MHLIVAREAVDAHLAAAADLAGSPPTPAPATGKAKDHRQAGVYREDRLLGTDHRRGARSPEEACANSLPSPGTCAIS